jgi:polyferredoxin
MRRFYLYFPGMEWADFLTHVSVALIGVIAFSMILLFTFFFGRIWCGFICPVGGFAELVSRALGDRWKIEFRSLPQVQIRYGYLSVYLVLMPMLGVSACTLCNFITVPRFVEALGGGVRGLAYIFSAVGLVNFSLLLFLGFFANKGRAYCQFLCPIGAFDALVNRIGARFRFTYHIRVDKQRCTGCNECAKKCMCGAIQMVDKVAVVDQVSCMSCHDCVDACDWNAIEWTPAPRNKTPKRIKRGVSIHPEPQWQAIHFKPRPVVHATAINWARVFNGVIVMGLTMVIFVTEWLH